MLTVDPRPAMSAPLHLVPAGAPGAEKLFTSSCYEKPRGISILSVDGCLKLAGKTPEAVLEVSFRFVISDVLEVTHREGCRWDVHPLHLHASLTADFNLKPEMAFDWQVPPDGEFFTEY
ncbi:unnamed protein product [Effrenium voratum]|uniref:Uncharacterized protein n=1 Tax=Effrenium voratum TaxID=2562239 RepID=A0AA36JKG9_9DINO|nr:unnamed protein product [Effrenium voratum]CAJ1433838.1 unnamed protein product [Effrenium voratum]